MSRLLKLSSGAERIINILEQKGYQAYAVGGGVRDLLLGLTPADWDIASSALPQDVMEAFNGYSVIPTGIKHGTVTVIMEGTPFEITTFRTEGRYVAHRRPEKVNFVSELSMLLICRRPGNFVSKRRLWRPTIWKCALGCCLKAENGPEGY